MKNLPAILLAASLYCVFSGAAHADLIVDFRGTRNQENSTLADFQVADPNLDASTPVGVANSQAANTHNITGSTSADLLNSPLMAVVTENGGGFNPNNGAFAGTPILDGFSNQGGGASIDITVSSLEEIAPGSLVTLTVYSAGDNLSQFGQVDFNYNGSLTDIGTTDPANNVTFVQTTFTKVAGQDSINVVANNGGANDFVVVNGLSLSVAPATVPVPEPSSLVSLGLLGLAIARRRRRSIC